MEFISSIQIIVAVLVIIALVIQQVMIGKGMLVEVEYPKSRRFGMSLCLAAIPIVPGLMTGFHALVIGGVVLGIISYHRNTWHKIQSKQ